MKRPISSSAAKSKRRWTGSGTSAKAGDVLWTGVGCVHAFANTGREPVRWLETFSPQPPSENVFRFVAEWEQRARELEGSAS